MEKNRGLKGSVVTGSKREPLRDTTPTLKELKIWSIPEIVDTSEKRENARGGMLCHNDDALPNNSKKKPCGWSVRRGKGLGRF